MWSLYQAFIEVKMFDETLHQYHTEVTRWVWFAVTMVIIIRYTPFRENLLNIYQLIENKDKQMMKM